MANQILQVSEDFWNIRGSFRIGGVIDVGTQASLIRLASGRFVFLDAYTLRGSVRREVEALTGDGRDVEAILNLHPFHTVHVRRMHQWYPQARLYGTARHRSRFPELPWSDTCTRGCPHSRGPRPSTCAGWASRWSPGRSMLSLRAVSRPR